MQVQTQSRDASNVARAVNTPLRVAAFWLAYWAIFIGLGLVLGLVPPALRMLAAGLVVTAATVALTIVFTRSEGLSRAAAGADWANGSLKRFVLGFAFGAAMVVLLIGLTRLALGPVTFVRNGATGTSLIILMTVTFIALSAGEELGFRGYPFQRLRERYGIIAAQIIVALVFAVYHLLQGWPLVNALVGTTAGSVLFGVAVLASRGLAFPIGVHAAWNAGSWLLGMKDEAGYWRLEPGRQPSFVEGAAIYLTVLGVSILALGWWMRRVAARS